MSSLKKMSDTTVYPKCEKYPTARSAMGDWVVERLPSLEPGTDYETPKTVRYLSDTTSTTGNWKRTKNYYGQSLGGTDWPDRFLISSVQQ